MLSGIFSAAYRVSGELCAWVVQIAHLRTIHRFPLLTDYSQIYSMGSIDTPCTIL
jgi:hypothetical protein